MKILYTPMEYDYGIIERGRSFEDVNFYESFVHMGHEVVRFDCVGTMQKIGKEAMNRALLEKVRSEKPDLVFFILFKDEFDPKVLAEISALPYALTLNWFCDDHWRFDNFSIKWAPLFQWVTTTDKPSVEKYHRHGYHTVLLTQWACNHHMYVKKPVTKCYDVSFIGQPYGERKKIIARLKEDGIDVRNWGFGSEHGRVSFERMVEIFNASKINLNFSASYVNKYKFWQRKRDQIKARNFEIPGCGGFQLASFIPSIDAYLSIGREIACYHNYSDLLEQIRYYLSHETEREAIAEAGYRRVLAEHTYDHRFHDIFSAVMT